MTENDTGKVKKYNEFSIGNKFIKIIVLRDSFLFLFSWD